MFEIFLFEVICRKLMFGKKFCIFFLLFMLGGKEINELEGVFLFCFGV